jgi:hypothetical protein
MVYASNWQWCTLIPVVDGVHTTVLELSYSVISLYNQMFESEYKTVEASIKRESHSTYSIEEFILIRNSQL